MYVYKGSSILFKAIMQETPVAQTTDHTHPYDPDGGKDTKRFASLPFRSIGMHWAPEDCSCKPQNDDTSNNLDGSSPQH